MDPLSWAGEHRNFKSVGMKHGVTFWCYQTKVDIFPKYMV